MVVRTQIQHLVARVRELPPLPAAFVYPCDPESLQLAVSSAFTATLAPLLVGPEVVIRDVAGRAGIDIARLPIVDTVDDPHATVLCAIDAAREGRVAALVKGALAAEEMLTPLSLPFAGPRGNRRLSHAAFVDVPGRDQGLLVADTLLNPAPDVSAKHDIVQNTIDLAHAVGIATPRVALIAAKDKVSPSLPSTGDAAMLRTMADDGVFGDAIVDGPLTVDSALSEAAARANGCTSEVAGRADVLIAPAMEAAAIALRMLTGLTGGLAAGLVLGSGVPIVVPARSDSMEVGMASCVLASLMAAHLEAARNAEAAGRSEGSGETNARASLLRAAAATSAARTP